MVGRCDQWVTFENVFKAVVLLMVWGLLSFPIAVYYASKEKSTSSNWLENISVLLHSLEGNCGAENGSDVYGTSNGNLAQDCSSSDTASQVGILRVNDDCARLHLPVGSLSCTACTSPQVRGARTTGVCRSALDCVQPTRQWETRAQYNLTIQY